MEDRRGRGGNGRQERARREWKTGEGEEGIKEGDGRNKFRSISRTFINASCLRGNE
jgi:hypothetical protein